MRTLDDILQGEDMQSFLMKCSVSFKFFCERVIQNPIDHKKGLQIKDYHMEWFYSIHNKKRTVIAAPRGHGKTEILGVAYPLWICLFNQFKEILIVANTLEQSGKILTIIKETIRQNELLSNLLPVDADAKWSMSEIHLSTRCKIYCKPNNENARGVHVDYVILDEVSLFKDKSVFARIISPTAQTKNGNICAIGTPMTEFDLLSDLQNNPEFESLVYKAEYVDEKGKRHALWPEVFSLEKLDQIKKEIGEDAYNKEYLVTPIPKETQLFKNQKIHECVQWELGFMEPEFGKTYFLGADFAISSESHADFTVFTIIEKTDDDKYIIRYMERLKGMPPKTQEAKLIALNQKWKLKRMNLDESNFGKIIVQNLIDDFLPIVGTPFDAQTRNQLLAFLQRIVENNQLVIPRGNGAGICHYLTGILIEELSKFGYESDIENPTVVKLKSFGAHDDTVISLALACKAAGVSRKFVSYVSTDKEVKDIGLMNEYDKEKGVIHINFNAREK